jgi:hypothetical protein
LQEENENTGWGRRFASTAGGRRELHFVTAEILVVEALQPLAQLFVGALFGDSRGLVGIFQHFIVDKNGAI